MSLWHLPLTLSVPFSAQQSVIFQTQKASCHCPPYSFQWLPMEFRRESDTYQRLGGVWSSASRLAVSPLARPLSRSSASLPAPRCCLTGAYDSSHLLTCLILTGDGASSLPAFPGQLKTPSLLSLLALNVYNSHYLWPDLFDLCPTSLKVSWGQGGFAFVPCCSPVFAQCLCLVGGQRRGWVNSTSSQVRLSALGSGLNPSLDHWFNP